MFGGNVDPKKMKEMMKKLNMQVEEMNAEEVLIKKEDGDIKIKNPEIMITNMSGRKVFQITGDISEASGPSKEDIEMVMEQTGADEETVSNKLEELNNDLAQAIIDLKSKK